MINQCDYSDKIELIYVIECCKGVQKKNKKVELWDRMGWSVDFYLHFLKMWYSKKVAKCDTFYLKKENYNNIHSNEIKMSKIDSLF